MLEVLILVTIAITRSEAAVCGVCDTTTNIACLNENQFRQCSSSAQVGPIISCPIGTVCASGMSASCQIPTDTVTSDCSSFCSGECSPTDVFVCTGPYSYRSCTGTSGNIVCDLGSICTTTMCQAKSTTTVPLCPNLTPTVPSTGPTATFCGDKLNQGRYTSSPPDPFCKKYTLCYLNNGVMRNKEYTCPGSTRFDAATGSCVNGIPTGCVR